MRVESGEGIESHEAEFKELSNTIELLQGRIQKLEEALASDQVNDSRILQLQQIIADRASKKMEYDDTIVHQMIECVKVYPDGRLDISSEEGISSKNAWKKNVDNFKYN